jgi:hypothetical protein
VWPHAAVELTFEPPCEAIAPIALSA